MECFGPFEKTALGSQTRLRVHVIVTNSANPLPTQLRIMAVVGARAGAPLAPIQMPRPADVQTIQRLHITGFLPAATCRRPPARM
jgi:hypothetical protein